MIGWRDLRLGKSNESYPFSIIINSYEGDEVFVKFPNYFICSRYRKFVKVVGVSAFVPMTHDAYGNQYANTQYIKTDHIEFHASFNQEGDNSDEFICMCNERLLEPKRYEQYTTFIGFRVWFIDTITNEIVKVQPGSKVIIQLVLEC